MDEMKSIDEQCKALAYENADHHYVVGSNYVAADKKNQTVQSEFRVVEPWKAALSTNI